MFLISFGIPIIMDLEVFKVFASPKYEFNAEIQKIRTFFYVRIKTGKRL